MNEIECDTQFTKTSPVTGDSRLHQSFFEELEEIYNVEKQLMKFLPKLAGAAHSPELRLVFEERFLEKMNHILLVEAAAKSLNEPLKSKTSHAMTNLLHEAQELMEEKRNSSTLDVALIAAARKIENYGITAYSKLLAWADEMGNEEAVYLLDETFADEKAADKIFCDLAEAIAASALPAVSSNAIFTPQVSVAA
jgi:ferritin-like metal-binding protein YciE